MSTRRFILVSMFIAMLGHSIYGNAEDIDLYGTSASLTDTDLPNLLFVLDNAANWNASSTTTCTYDDTGGSPSLGATTGGIEQCALNNAINALPLKADGSAVIKLGIMIYNKQGMDTLYGCNASQVGGCLMFPLTIMNTTGKAALMATIKAWTSGGIQSNSESTGQTMQEAWAYYAGRTGLSGTTYTSPALEGCAKNFVLFIGNAINNSGSPGDGGSASPSASLTSTVDGNAALTATQKAELKAAIQISSGAYGTSAFTCSPNPYSMPNHTDSSGLYADEWARYMSSVDLKTHAMPAATKVITYTIGVLSSDCKANYPALLTSMAGIGGGKYFPSGNTADLLQAILRVLNEVQAVNSVFASASLPVSINTQGTYRNQIFMGMFRPDGGGLPRWNGNLKQYQLGYVPFDPLNSTTTPQVFLADAMGYDAIRQVPAAVPARPVACTAAVDKPGFLDPCAASFWTCANSSHTTSLGAPYSSLAACALDPAAGFWANMPSGQGYAWDLPDGEVVEKGGASQMLRLSNLTSVASRKLYTDCSGTNCALSSTPFATTNGAITDTLLGTGPITITSITSAATVQATSTLPGPSGAAVQVSITNFAKGSGSTVTATVSATDLAKLSVSTQLLIATGQSKYDCNPCTVTAVNAGTNTFTYSGTNGNQAAPATPYTATVYTRFVTVTKIGHGLSVGQTLTFSNCLLYAPLNHTVVAVSTVIDANNFTVATTEALVGILPDLLCRYTPNTATVTTQIDHGLFSGAFVTIAGAGGSTTLPYTGYNGAWSITVTGNTTFTYQYSAAAPLANFSGAATLTSTSTTRLALINWMRGEDNYGDESSICPPGSTAGAGNCPNPKVIVRPSVHGDVLHSRPIVLDYGGTTGVVAFYGDNGGIFHAVNGNQTAAISGTNAGGELWGFIPSEFFGKLKRLHDNSPVLKLPSTPAGIIPAPRNKDYFVDGSIGVYQVLNADGTTATANLYLTMRRGGRFIYALDVSTPTNPKLLWKRSYTDTGYSELGQTWSQPKVAYVKGWTNPVLIFGAGYDAAAEDVEPPTADTMGRGIFILDATNGNVVWKATYGAATACPNAAGCTLPNMKYSIPSDITLIDRDGDGKIDRLYVGDMGGNVWRVDLEVDRGDPPALVYTPDVWQVEKLAALGCDSGECASGHTPRKIFYPPEVITASAITPPYDAVFVATGDREHPLYSTVSQSACTVTNRAYLLTDPKTGKDGSGLVTIGAITDLFNATARAWDGTLRGYYITFQSCEKSVNAPLVVAGKIYFGTNKAKPVVANACNDLLGTATGYSLTPLLTCAGSAAECPKNWSSVTFAGGGLPPSPMAGVVVVRNPVTGTDVKVPFCIGCGGTEGGSPLAAIRPDITVPTTRTRTYWYLKDK